MNPAHPRRRAVILAMFGALGIVGTALFQGAPSWFGAAAAAPSVAPGSGPSLGSLFAAQLAPVAAPTATALPSPCRHNHRAQLVVVSIAHQHAWACAGNHTVLSTPVTTGARGEATPRGSFAVQGLIRRTTLTTSSGASYRVKYWIPFRLGIWGFHDASWQTMPFGSSRYRSDGSHGCVHLPLKAMRWLFGWIRYGTTVRVQ